MLNPRSPLKTNIETKTPLSAPAGRSPTKKRVGILNRRRSGGSPNAFTRVDPPAFGGGNPGARGGLPFTIDAALKGTIPGYARRNTTTSIPRPAPTTQSSHSSASTSSLTADMSAIPELYQASPKPSWFFEIREDTIEEENTNLMYHSTCTLDISSDEESTSRIHDLRGKENVPPMDDQSQTSFRPSPYHQQSAGTALKNRLSRKEKDIDACDVDRSPLGEMSAEDFYADGFDANSSFVFLDDVYEEVEVEISKQEIDGMAYETAAASLLKSKINTTFDFSTVPQIRIQTETELEVEVEYKGKGKSIEELMKIDRSVAGLPAAVLQPIEKAEEGWKIWESGSVSGDE